MKTNGIELIEESTDEIIYDILNAYLIGLSTNPEVESIYMYSIEKSESRNNLPIIIVKVIYNNESKKEGHRELNTTKYGVNLTSYEIYRKNIDYNELLNENVIILYDKNNELKKLQDFIKNLMQQNTISTKTSFDELPKHKM